MFNNHMFDNHFLKACLAAVLAIGLTACSSSSDSGGTAMEPPPPAGPSAYEMALEAIAAADSAEAAQKVVDDVDADAVTGTELESLKMAVAQKTMELAAAAAKERRDMLIAAAMCEEATAECVAAHDALIAALQADVDRLANDDDATNAQQAAAQKALEDAQAARNMVQMDLEELDRTTTAGREVGEAIDAANGLADNRSAEAIAAAKVAIEEAEMAVGDSDAYDERIAMAKTAVARAEELNSIDAALMAADEAADGLVADSSADAVSAAQALIDAAQALIDGNTYLTEAEETSYGEDIADLQRPVTVAKAKNDAAAEEKRLADEKAKEEEQRKANEAMAATATKLYAGIGAAPLVATGDGVRTAVYSGDGDADITVTFDPDLTTAGSTDVMQALESDETTVAANHGWEGMRYTATTTGGDMYEAYVYSNVEAPKMGRKFGSAATVTPTGAYEYQLDAADRDGNANMALTYVAGTHAALVSLPSVTRTVGTETFNLPEQNPGGVQFITVSGMLHGVSGTFSCAPTTPADGCTAAVADEGFTLDGGTWLFIPSNAEARVMGSDDDAYASYGWWLRKAANDGPFIASAFVDNKGDAPEALDATNTGALRGTATYMGGAAGKYALSSSTGGTNDAGHFTARATLNATFAETHQISGTIDNFIGADGQSRDWSIKLNDSIVSDAGVIAGDPDDSTDTGAQMTVWTIGDGPAAASGQWSGNLQEAGDDNVPQVATGTFYTKYGMAGRMVGAFGANEQ